MNYVWYVGYGSNLLEERFLCYIKGGKFRMGGSTSKGCEDRTSPLASKPTIIPAQMYFAVNSKSWQGSAVAFICYFKLNRIDSRTTLGRMWKISEEQFEGVRHQEGRSLYNKVIELGESEDGCRIVNLTRRKTFIPNKPSVQYLCTIAWRLKETFGMNNGEIKGYLKEMPGIKDTYSEEQLISIFI